MEQWDVAGVATKAGVAAPVCTIYVAGYEVERHASAEEFFQRKSKGLMKK